VLFTEGDFVVPASQVIDFWTAINHQEIELHQITGKNINHMQGLVKAPEEYKSTIRAFLQKHIEQ
jgi:hypothetical protein